MFAKLLKYEWKASAKLLSILSLAAVGVSLLETVVLRLLISGSKTSSTVSTTMVSPLLSMMLFLSIALIAYVIGVQIILIVRFFKSRFGDEGYLTFTLPVNSHQIFLSSMLNMVFWTLISGAVTVVCAGMIVFGGTAGLVDDKIWTYIWEGIQYSFNVSADTIGGGYWAIVIVGAIVSLFSAPVITITAFTLGAVWAKKHKILAAFGATYLISLVSGIVSTVVYSIVSVAVLAASADNAAAILQANYWVEIFMQLAMMIAGYMLSVWLMDNRLNLT